MKSPKSLIAVAVLAAAWTLPAGAATHHESSAPGACRGDNGGLSLSPGFCASVWADNLGHVRHLAVSSQGVVYANTWSGRYYHNDTPPPGGFVLALRDSAGAGRADEVQRIGPGQDEGATGGTGIALYKDYVYAEAGDSIVRYPLRDGAVSADAKPEVVLSGMPLGGDHPMHPFVIDARGQLFVDMGSASNACQERNRTQGSSGQQPCDELQTRAGIWRYDANRTGQSFSPAQRWATGLRNSEGYAFDAGGRFFATQHGRDQLSQNWPELYQAEQGAELPAEELVQVEQDGDYGWPQCYYDERQRKLVLAPEYGGDGGKAVGVCAQKKPPVAAFPAHWAPNDLLIADAKLPPAYRGGAFIAFHGSWNRAPAPQGGYNLVFQPLKGGKAAGPWVVFADGFAGAVKEPGRAAFRPTGLAEGPDGALYVADDRHGRIWRIAYRGDPARAKVQAAPPASVAQPSADALPPEGIHPDAGLPVPPGATAEQVELGGRIFRGQVAGGTCLGCHGSDAKGSSVGPDLTSGSWVWGDGSLAAIASTIRNGVPSPKNFSGVMPPEGGAQLSDEQVQAVAAYVWAVGHRGK